MRNNSLWLNSAAAALLLASAYILFVAAPGGQEMPDFEVYRRAAQRWRSGLSIYGSAYPITVSPDQSLELFYIYPPTLAWLLTLLADSEYLPALWRHINFVSLICAVGLLPLLASRSTGIVPYSRHVVVLLGLACVSKPLALSFSYGQVNVVVLALLVLYLVLLQRGRAAGAGFSLGLAIALKISPVVLALPLLADRRRRVLSGLCLALVLAILPVLSSANGANQMLSFVRDGWARSSREALLGYADNFALPALLPAPFGLLVALCAAGALGLHAVLLSRRGSDRVSYALLTCVMLLLSPLLWEHHLVWLILPLYILACGCGAAGEKGFAFLLFAACNLPLPLLRWSSAHAAGAVFLVRLLPVLIILGAAWRLAGAPGRATPRA